MEEVVGHVRGEVLELSQELRQFAIAHFLECEKLANALLSGKRSVVSPARSSISYRGLAGVEK
jgi:hypothetical protein